MQVENNILIAEFMGLVAISFPTTPQLYYTKKSIEGFGMGELIELQYHKDWNYLMGVVEQINIIDDFEYSVTILSMDCEITDSKMKTIVSIDCQYNTDELIKSVYDACVEFIKWYNQQKK